MDYINMVSSEYSNVLPKWTVENFLRADRWDLRGRNETSIHVDVSGTHESELGIVSNLGLKEIMVSQSGLEFNKI